MNLVRKFKFVVILLVGYIGSVLPMWNNYLPNTYWNGSLSQFPENREDGGEHPGGDLPPEVSQGVQEASLFEGVDLGKGIIAGSDAANDVVRRLNARLRELGGGAQQVNPTTTADQGIAQNPPFQQHAGFVVQLPPPMVVPNSTGQNQNVQLAWLASLFMSQPRDTAQHQVNLDILHAFYKIFAFGLIIVKNTLLLPTLLLSRLPLRQVVLLVCCCYVIFVFSDNGHLMQKLFSLLPLDMQDINIIKRAFEMLARRQLRTSAEELAIAEQERLAFELAIAEQARLALEQSGFLWKMKNWLIG